MNDPHLRRCRCCGCWIDPRLGYLPTEDQAGRTGSKPDPRAPGDSLNLCYECQHGTEPEEKP